MSREGGLIQEIFMSLIAIINDPVLTNSFYAGNVKDGKPKKRDIVVSLPEVNGHILAAMELAIKEIERQFPKDNYSGSNFNGRIKLIGK